VKPTIVTGSGRSGTHWLAHVLNYFMDARHEPEGYDAGEIIVDCRARKKRKDLERDGHKLIHLVRDGRDVVRSAHTFWDGSYTFEEMCREWAQAVDQCAGMKTIRLRDIARPQASTSRYLLPHWSLWDEQMTDTFWRICGEQMRRHGYER